MLSAAHDELANGDLVGLRRMKDKRDLHVEVQGDDIVVSLPGTSYVVTYYRATAFPQQLLTKSHSGREDQDAPMTQAEFHARAWKAAKDKARELGWIVKGVNV